MTNAEKTLYRRIEIHHGKHGIHGEHGLPRERLSFRVFRDFRGSCSFRGFRAFRGSVLFIVALAAFAVLLAAPPAPAQSPAILLNIKSPATTSPPSESLLTLDEEGNLWIKGHLYDYAFQTEITLDPNRDYWTIRDATGKVVWALEVYNPASGASTGDLYSIGSFEGWAAEPDQTGAILRYTNASSEVVFSLTAAGEARSAATAPQRGTPAPWPDPPALGDIPDSSDDPPTVDQRAEAAGRDLYEIVPAPQAQGRIFFSVGPNWPVGADRDVTGIPWRLRWYPSITTLRDYGVHLGCRYRECFNQSQWWYRSADANGVFWEADAEVGMDEYGPLILWWPQADGWGYFGSNWNVAYNPPVPPTNYPPATPLTFGATWSDSAPSGWDNNWGNPVDAPTAAYTRLFLYWIEFDTMRSASAVPHEDGDPWMNVRCCLQPRPMPAGWINHIELTLWDPAAPSHRRVISGPSGQAWISTMWDGKLYLDGNENNPPFYTQASDVFMQATVFWNNSSPQKPWENVDETTFQELRLVMHRPAAVWSDATPYRYLDEGVVRTEPGTTNIPMQAFFNIGGEYPQARVLWEVPAAVGSIPVDQINSTAPVHTSPATPGFGYIRLKSEYYSAQYQAWLPTPAPYRSWGVRISGTHLERDMENETALNLREIHPGGVCWAAANHAYKGEWGESFPFGTDGGENDIIYRAPDDDPLTTPTDALTPQEIAAFHKGDVLYLYGHCDHIVTITADGSNTVWEYNGLTGAKFGKSTVASYLSWQTNGQRRVNYIKRRQKP